MRLLVVPLVVILAVGVLAAGVSAFWVLTILPRSLPSVTQLESFEPSVGSKVYDENDEPITEFHVERRIFVTLGQMPPALKQAVIATEDSRFYSHFGVDPMGIARAVYQNFRRGRIVEGGSTITQQLAKVLFLTPDRSLDRKLKEAVLAIERRSAGDLAFTLYTNESSTGRVAQVIQQASTTIAIGDRLARLGIAPVDQAVVLAPPSYGVMWPDPARTTPPPSLVEESADVLLGFGMTILIFNVKE